MSTQVIDVVEIPPSPYRLALVDALNITLPPHVRRAYSWNELRDVFMDVTGRLWYASTDFDRNRLPTDPLEQPKIPQQFWAPEARKRRQQTMDAAAWRQIDDSRAPVPT